MLNTLLLASAHGSSGDEGLVFVVPIVAILCTFTWLIVKAIMAPFHRNGTPRPDHRAGSGAPNQTGGLSDEEIALLQKLSQTLALMERRVESLETILIDQTRTKEKYGTKL